MRPDNLCVSEWNLLEDNRLPVCLVEGVSKLSYSKKITKP